MLDLPIGTLLWAEKTKNQVVVSYEYFENASLYVWNGTKFVKACDDRLGINSY